MALQRRFSAVPAMCQENYGEAFPCLLALSSARGKQTREWSWGRYMQGEVQPPEDEKTNDADRRGWPERPRKLTLLKAATTSVKWGHQRSWGCQETEG